MGFLIIYRMNCQKGAQSNANSETLH
jgi:hypothetical protein